MLYLFLDESGDLGFDFVQKKPSEHFVVTPFPVKRYFYEKAKNIDFKLFTLILPKKNLLNFLIEDKARVYNYVTQKLLGSLPLEKIKGRLILTLDRSKRKPEIKEFNEYIYASLKSRLPLHTPLDIHHFDSQETKELQATDLFAWGIFRKYEVEDTEWYDCFKDRISVEYLYE